MFSKIFGYARMRPETILPSCCHIFFRSFNNTSNFLESTSCLTTLIQNVTENHNIIKFEDNWFSGYEIWCQK